MNPPASNTSSAQAKRGLLLPIILMVWPLAALLLGLIGYAILNFVSSGNMTSPGPVQSVINVLLFLLGTSSVVLGVPSFIAGLIILIVRLSKK